MTAPQDTQERSPATDETTVAALLELGNISASTEENETGSQPSKSPLSLPTVEGEDRSSEKGEEPALVDESTITSAAMPQKKKSVSQKTRWNNMFNTLLKYKEEYGNTLVPFNYDITGTKLGRWVNKQRSQYNNLRRGRQSQMTMERVERLEEVGFEWSVNPLPAMEQWEAKWELLRDFKLRYGHCRVPDNFVLEGVKLGQWVTYQRSQRSRKIRGLPCEITDEHIEKLDSLGFEWDNGSGELNPMQTAGVQPMSSHPSMQQMHGMPQPSWDSHFELLCRYKKVHGDTRVPYSYCLAGVALGEWVYSQRQELVRMKKGLPYALKGFQIDRLNNIGFEWNSFDNMDDHQQHKRMRMSHPISPGNDSERPMLGLGMASAASAQQTPAGYGNSGMSSPGFSRATSSPMDAGLTAGDRRALLERARMMEAVALQGEPEPVPEWNPPGMAPAGAPSLDRMVMREKQMRAAALYQNEAMMDHQPPQQSQQMYRQSYFR